MWNPVLDMLSKEFYVSGEAMSNQLGITRMAIWKKIEALREQGWRIESGAKKGYHLEMGDRIEPELWRWRLLTQWCGKAEMFYQTEVDSTNRVLKQLALEGAGNGSVALCERQTAGRGRLGRQWISEPGVGLWQSVLLRPSLRPSQAPLLTFVAAISMAQALEKNEVDRVRIKWPNDLVLDGKKICGILNEVSCDPDTIEYVVLGVGLNVKHGAIPEGLEKTAGSLEDAGFTVLRRDIMVSYLECLERNVDIVERKGFGALTQTYAGYSCTFGSDVEVIGQSERFTGEAKGMDESGALLVEDPAGVIHRVMAGDVSVRGVMGYV
ncbi:MAG: biotin--[Clostridia bacterium]|nr:biotin--[acetyl-CoA-carboxylase] ligase [Clostridia bacterium]